MKMRDPYLDNAKLSLIWLVVFGHLLEPIMDRSPIAHAVYLVVFAFHMPAFVFLAGVTTQAERWNQRDRSLLWSLILFQCLYMLAAYLCNLRGAFQFPYWLLWFIVSLLFWRRAANLLSGRFAGWSVLICAVSISAAAGYLPLGRPLSLMRTLVFSPLFFLGFFYGHPTIAFLRKRPASAALLSLAILIGALVLALRIRVDPEWLYGATRYSVIATPFLPKWTFRLLLLTTGSVLTAAFLMLVPTSKGCLTERGKNTLPVYLFHGLAIFPLRGVLAQAPMPVAWMLVLAGSVVMVALFSLDAVSRGLAAIVNVAAARRVTNPARSYHSGSVASKAANRAPERSNALE
jgi:fucose 4-O-acetylase-like acetyltransferase